MPTIADQVATMEHDHAAALVLIDQLNAANAALTSANTSLQNDNVALQLEVNDMKHYVDDTRAMAEQLAASAYEMLRASRRQVGTPAEVIPFAPKPKDGLDAKLAAVPETWPTQSDSGDEQPVTKTVTLTDAQGQPVTQLQADDEIEIIHVSTLPPHAGPMRVIHEGDLPIFLKRDTPHGAVFG